jgi:membrane associated rhomboid family serine protease
MPPVTLTLIFANVAIFLVGQTSPDMQYWLDVNFALWPVGAPAPYPSFLPWQLVTYAFLHGGFWHIALNMYALWMFGSDLERVFGTRRYLLLYFVSVVAAALTQLAVAYMAGGNPVPVVGASGGIFGVLLAFGMYFPRRTILLLIPPIPMPAWVFVIVYGAIELFMGVTGTEQGVAHFAHLGGMLGALLLILQWRGKLF